MKVSQTPFQIDLLKANPTSSTKEGVIDYEIGGYISSEKLDAQNERIIQKGIDFDTYKANRRLKWEHGSSPAVNIGFVNSIELRKGRAYMVARIYAVPGTPQYKTAQEVIGDIKNIFAFNKSYPNDPKILGFSVEGGKLAKVGKDVTRSVVTNVVLTTCPINTDAAVDHFKDSSSALFKSFMAGTEVVPTEMTGSEALRPENLSNHNIKTQMKNIKSKEDAITFYKSQGKTEDEAKTLAEGWETENNSRVAISKSLNDSIEKLEKSVTDNGTFATTIGSTDFEGMSKSFKNSLTPDSENKINPAMVMAESTNLQISLAKSQLAKDEAIIKSNGLVLEAVKDFALLLKSFNNAMNDVKDDTSSVIEFNEGLSKSLAKLDAGATTENLATEKVAGEGDADPDKKTEPKFTPSQVIGALQKSAEKAFDSGDRIAADNFNSKLSKAQSYAYSFEALPEDIKSDVETFYK